MVLFALPLLELSPTSEGDIILLQTATKQAAIPGANMLCLT